MFAEDNARAWLWLQQTFGIATNRMHKVLQRFGHPCALLDTPAQTLREAGGFSAAELQSILSPDWAAIDAALQKTRQIGGFVLTPDSAAYPDALRNIHAMPPILFCKGDAALLRGHYLIAMVGAREPDEYGAAAAKKLSGEIAALGGVVVSGLALGVDAVCHRAALEAGGKTVAFLSTGLDVDYPRGNHALRAAIENPAHGLVATEYWPGQTSRAHHFLMRNRMISGVAMATVVVQCTLQSGTMITAGHAVSQSRDLYAVPGSIFSPLGEGCNHLLTQGAQPAVSGEEILMQYVAAYGYPLSPPKNAQLSLFAPAPPCPQGAQPAPRRKPRAAKQQPQTAAPLPDYLTPQQAAVMTLLRRNAAPMAVQELCAALGLPAGELLTLLTGLELYGLAQTLPGRRVAAV